MHNVVHSNGMCVTVHITTATKIEVANKHGKAHREIDVQAIRVTNIIFFSRID